MHSLELPPALFKNTCTTHGSIRIGDIYLLSVVDLRSSGPQGLRPHSLDSPKFGPRKDLIVLSSPGDVLLFGKRHLCSTDHQPVVFAFILHSVRQSSWIHNLKLISDGACDSRYRLHHSGVCLYLHPSVFQKGKRELRLRIMIYTLQRSAYQSADHSSQTHQDPPDVSPRRMVRAIHRKCTIYSTFEVLLGLGDGVGPNRLSMAALVHFGAAFLR